jgi:hypothetical protein
MGTARLGHENQQMFFPLRSHLPLFPRRQSFCLASGHQTWLALENDDFSIEKETRILGAES